jgi:hypothetical protein
MVVPDAGNERSRPEGGARPGDDPQSICLALCIKDCQEVNFEKPPGEARIRASTLPLAESESVALLADVT